MLAELPRHGSLGVKTSPGDDATALGEHSRSLGHVPIVKPVKRRPRAGLFGQWEAPRQFRWIEEERFKQRTIVERVNARLKEEFGGRFLYVRGAQKVMAHWMFGVLALTVDQLLRLGG